SYYLRLLRVAYHDCLTGLPNRILFQDRLSQGIALAKREDRYCALIYLDLDRFKPVNDTYGHHVGDQVLKLVADRLRQCVRESDMVARLSGDEFTIILPQIKEKNDAEAVVKKIIVELSKPFYVNEHHLQLDVSVGIAIYPDNGNNGDLLLKAADDAMYHAKGDGGSAYCFAEKICC
ncbi:MAG TPA: GGDEF domain-containing protein, partial [Opitutales bacterium]|nr:GGDEF domain-containing protein [Opitutales bacterium]